MYQHNSPNSEVRAEQAASKSYQLIKLGLDVHAEWIVVVRIAPARRTGLATTRFWRLGALVSWLGP